MSWVPRIVGPLFRALRFGRTVRGIRTVSRVGRRGRIQAMKYPVKKPGSRLVKRHVKKKLVPKKKMSAVYRMPYFSRPRRFRRRRYGRKKIVNKVHRYLRYADKDTQYPGSTGPNTIISTGADQHLAYSFKLDNVVNPSDFTNLYDMYRVNKIKLFLEPLWDQTGQPGLSFPQSHKLRVVHDYNDNNPLTQEDDYLEYSSCKSYSPWSRRGIAITLYPKINNKVENAGGTDAFTSMNANRVWFNIVDDEIPMFGLKIFIPGGLATNETPLFKVRAKFDMSFKNSK